MENEKREEIMKMGEKKNVSREQEEEECVISLSF